MRLINTSAGFTYLLLLLNTVVVDVRSIADDEDSRYTMLRKRGVAKPDGRALDEVG